MADTDRIDSIDMLLELLDDKVVRGANGDLMIRVDDMRALKKQFDELKAEEAEKAKEKPRSLVEARERMMADPEFMKGFQKAAATVADDVKPVAEGAPSA